MANSLLLKVDFIGDAKKLGASMKKSNTGLKAWGKEAGKFAKGAALAFTAVAGAIIGTGTAAVDMAYKLAQAANEDAKSQKLLAGQLKRSGKATKDQVKNSEALITKLQLQTGILDDDLRPALGTLVRSTGDVKKAQKLLKVALDASVGSGKPLASVAQAVGKAFNGSNTSLLKLMPSLKNSKKPLDDLAKAFQGVAAEQADPFMKLKAATSEIQESLGMVFLPYFEDAATRIGDAVNKMLNPDSAEGKAFADVKEALKGVVDELLTFFDIKGDPNESTVVKALKIVKEILDDIKRTFKIIKPFWDTLTGKQIERAGELGKSAGGALKKRLLGQGMTEKQIAGTATGISQATKLATGVVSVSIAPGGLFAGQLINQINKQLKLNGKKPLQ